MKRKLDRLINMWRKSSQRSYKVRKKNNPESRTALLQAYLRDKWSDQIEQDRDIQTTFFNHTFWFHTFIYKERSTIKSFLQFSNSHNSQFSGSVANRNFCKIVFYPDQIVFFVSYIIIKVVSHNLKSLYSGSTINYRKPGTCRIQSLIILRKGRAG